MQIITTEFKGPTNSNGSRIHVRSWLKSATVPYDHALSGLDNHRVAAEILVKRLNSELLSKNCSLLWEIVAEGELPTKGHGFVIELQEVSAE